MKKDEMIWIATWAFSKRLDFGELKYSDYMNGHEELTEQVWEYVEELQNIGKKAFYEKYKKFKLY